MSGLAEGEVRVYAAPENKDHVIRAKLAQGYELTQWIAGGYSGGDVAYFRRLPNDAVLRETEKWLHWALDIIDRTDRRLVALGEPTEAVNSAIHVQAKKLSRMVLRAAAERVGCCGLGDGPAITCLKCGGNLSEESRAGLCTTCLPPRAPTPELAFEDFERWVAAGGWARMEAPPLPAPGELVTWVKKRLEHGVVVTCGVSEIHRMLDAKQTLCLIAVPSRGHVIAIKSGDRRCRRCAALHRLGVTSLEEAVTLAVQSVA